MELSDVLPKEGPPRSIYCDSCGSAMDLAFRPFSELVSGVQIDIGNLPMLSCHKCGREFLSDRSAVAIGNVHHKAVTAGKDRVSVTRKTQPADYHFTNIPFLVDSDDYYYIPGLFRPSDVGFLTPLFFNKVVLVKFDNLPEYRVQFASPTYGTIYTESSHFSFGINRHGKVLMWLGDVAKASIINKMKEVYDQARAVKLTGNPDEDWKSVRAILEKGSCPRLKEVGDEARNIRLLDRGTQLRQALALDWRTNGSYMNALAITQTAFVHEHFASAQKPETGVVVMNAHKAKGKQFDEVIIFERGPRMFKGKIVANIDRIVWNNERVGDMGQARQTLRVSVTRARLRTTILTPKSDPCVLLLG